MKPFSIRARAEKDIQLFAKTLKKVSTESVVNPGIDSQQSILTPSFDRPKHLLDSILERESMTPQTAVEFSKIKPHEISGDRVNQYLKLLVAILDKYPDTDIEPRYKFQIWDKVKAHLTHVQAEDFMGLLNHQLDDKRRAHVVDQIKSKIESHTPKP